MQTGISINQQGKNAQPAQERVAGMDSIRFIAALWVAFYHLGFSSTFSLSERVSLEQKILGAALDSVFCGPAAVIVFFVICNRHTLARWSCNNHVRFFYFVFVLPKL